MVDGVGGMCKGDATVGSGVGESKEGGGGAVEVGDNLGEHLGWQVEKRHGVGRIVV